MKQKVYGALLILACAVMLALAAQGTTPIERDATPVLFLFPLGLHMIFTKKSLLAERRKEHGGSTIRPAAQFVQHQNYMGPREVSRARAR
jgi:hypothetical protein